MPEPATVATTDAEIDAALGRARAFARYDHHLTRAVYSSRTDRILLYLDNGVTQVIPRHLLQGLAKASRAALQKIELLGGGTGLYWPELDVAHSVSGLLAGVYGSAAWMKHLASSSTVERARASRPAPVPARGNPASRRAGGARR